MLLSFTSHLDSHFSDSTLNEPYKYFRWIKHLHPNSQHVMIVEHSFPLFDYLEHKSIQRETVEEDTIHIYSPNLYPQPEDGPDTQRPMNKKTICGVSRFTYEGVDFTVYRAETGAAGNGPPGGMFYDFVFNPPAGVVPPESPGTKLLEDVSKWYLALKENSIWVFDNGMWVQDVDLANAIKSSSWDTLVLNDKFVEGLKRDTNTFFASKKIYKSLGITWKRGILLLGPPGNGKTESIKALLNDTAQTALYVKTFSTMGGAEYGIRSIFEHARRHAPCILIIEDLDSMVTPGIRSFFLNELDGFAQNEGILTIATTNHPEDIDDAILNRPSRFDVKYDFKLPEEDLRKQFAVKWVRKLRVFESDPDIGKLFNREDDSEIASDVAKGTEGWSFAFLKELFVSFLLRFAHDKSLQGQLSPAETESMLFDQVKQLGLQIKKTKESEDLGDMGMSIPYFPPPTDRGVVLES